MLRVPCALPGGGLLELSGHFEIQKVMYGFCSVKDPQAVLPKYVLVNWVSRGSARAPPPRGSYNSAGDTGEGVRVPCECQ